jgi:hypothetical protein
LKLYFQLGGGGLAPPETVLKFGMNPRMRVGCRRSSGISFPFASTGPAATGLATGSFVVASVADV